MSRGLLCICVLLAGCYRAVAPSDEYEPPVTHSQPQPSVPSRSTQTHAVTSVPDAVDSGVAQPDANVVSTIADAATPSTPDAGTTVGISDARQLDLGASHACVVRNDGSLYCWGADWTGQVGQAPSPRNSDVGNAWLAVSAGHTHSCAITVDGRMYCWGSAYGGALGTGLYETVAEGRPPSLVTGDHVWTQVAAGENHTCGITQSGELYCWGIAGGGELGSIPGNYTCSDQPCALEPLRVGADSDWTALSAAGQTTCAIRAGMLFCWGSSTAKQLYFNCSETGGCVHDDLTRIGSDEDWSSVSTWASHTCAIKRDGSLWCWGYGRGMFHDTSTPTQMMVSGAAQVASGEDHTCVLTGDHVLACWGSDDFGQLGQGQSGAAVCDGAPCTYGFRIVGYDFAQVSVGLFHSCAIKLDGSLWCWGTNQFGEIGAATTENCAGGGVAPSTCARTPLPVANPENLPEN